MTDVEKQKQMEQIKQSEDGMRQTVLLIKIGLMVFLTFAWPGRDKPNLR